MIDLVTAIRSVRAEMNIAPATLTPLVLVGASRRDAGRAPSAGATSSSGWRGVATSRSPTRAPQGAVQLLVRGEVAALPLKGVIDLAAERARLDKEIAKADADIKRVDAKLGNANFVANAPEEVVEDENEKREEAEGAPREDRRGAGAAEGRGVGICAPDAVHCAALAA